MKINNTEEFECAVCHRKAIRATKARPGRTTKVNICRVNAVTCSNKCAREYRNNVDSVRHHHYKMTNKV